MVHVYTVQDEIVYNYCTYELAQCCVTVDVDFFQEK